MINTVGEDQPVMHAMSGKDIPSKNAKELAIFLRSCVLGIESGLNLLINEVRRHLVPEREREVYLTLGV